MVQVVAVDIGGTHARFAIADIVDGRVAALNKPVVMRAADHASFQLAWSCYARDVGTALPRAAAIAIACPVQGEVLQLTNNPWIIRPALIPEKLGVESWTLVNDFGAVAHAVAQVAEDQLVHLAGPREALSEKRVISIVGPGTGLGVAQLLRDKDRYHVVECEGGHVDFAPVDTVDDVILHHLRQHLPRVSVERVVSGPGLVNIYEALSAIEGRSVSPIEAPVLWEAAMLGRDELAAAALDRFCLSLGAVAGDIALSHGAAAVVIAGGIGPRIAHLLPQSGFATRFAAKGRFAARMEKLPVWLINHPQPGLYGAAAAFAAHHAH